MFAHTLYFVFFATSPCLTLTHSINNGHGPPRDMMRIVAAQRVIEDVHRKLSGVSGACTNGGSGGSGGEDVKYSSAAVTANTLLAGAMTAFFRERSTTATAASSPQVTAAQSTVRCPCGAQPERLPQVVCRGCGWLQHRQCVGLDSRQAGRGELFFCEVCRAKRADPFWEVEDSCVTPAIRLSSTGKQSSVRQGGAGLGQGKIGASKYTISIC